MSFLTFQQECEDCHTSWNAAFGIVGMAVIAEPPKKCPECGSLNIKKISDQWKTQDGELFPSAE